jgi:hypothetical protein
VSLKPAKGRGEDRKKMAALMAADQRVSFGPLFFMQNLRGLVRDRCPEPSESIPSVHVHLMDGEVLDLCHIIGVSPNWIAMAVHEEEHAERPDQMRTELVPYHLIARVSIQTTRHEGAHPIGFNTSLDPAVYGSIPGAAGMTPEEALKAVAGIPPASLPGSGGAPPVASKRAR